MPQYGTFRYGQIGKYGRYKLSTTDGRAIGPHVAYRIRLIDSERKRGEYITMQRDRVSLPTEASRIRIRANKDEWVYTQTDEINADAYRVRIRSLSSDGGISEWVYGERANLNLI